VSHSLPPTLHLPTDGEPGTTRTDARRRWLDAGRRATSSWVLRWRAGARAARAGGGVRCPHVLRAKHILVILNPSSGKAKPDAAERIIGTALEEVGATYELRTTNGAEDPVAWAERAATDGFDVVLAAGGDGTVTAVATGLLRSEDAAILGIVPMGTGNGLARVLRLPIDARKAILAMDAGHEVALDVMQVASPPSIALFFLGAGLDAEINRDADPAAKKRFGFLAYVGATARNLWGRRNHRVVLTVDGGRESFAAHTVTVFNAGQFELAGLEVGPTADPHDGQLDITVLRAPGFWRSLGAVLRLVSGQWDERATSRRARAFRIEAYPPLLVHVDGDVVGSTPIEATVLPGALRVIASADYPNERRPAGRPNGAGAPADPPDDGGAPADPLD
jgi:diacylglycerol kinase (ATP)